MTTDFCVMGCEELRALKDQVSAVKSIRQEYYNLVNLDRGLIGADTVLDMIDAAVVFEDRTHGH